MKYSVYTYTNKGGRTNNEDSLKCCAKDGRAVCVLADGLGGHDSGEVASQLAVDIIFAGCSATDCAGESQLLELFGQANQGILDRQSEPAQAEMKTTAVALNLFDDMAYWAHIGDSRLYHFSGGRQIFVTNDHSVTYKKYQGGEISYMDIYHDDDRSSLLRVLGKKNCQPECGAGEVRPGDAFLLCSDGFWEYVYQEEILVDLLKAETPEEWAQAMLLRYIRRIGANNDNVSFIAVFAEDEK